MALFGGERATTMRRADSSAGRPDGGNGTRCSSARERFPAVPRPRPTALDAVSRETGSRGFVQAFSVTPAPRTPRTTRSKGHERRQDRIEEALWQTRPSSASRPRTRPPTQSDSSSGGIGDRIGARRPIGFRQVRFWPRRASPSAAQGASRSCSRSDDDQRLAQSSGWPGNVVLMASGCR
jgi:hypothetical protein